MTKDVPGTHVNLLIAAPAVMFSDSKPSFRQDETTQLPGPLLDLLKLDDLREVANGDGMVAPLIDRKHQPRAPKGKH
jgi:hypothetical protein